AGPSAASTTPRASVRAISPNAAISCCITSSESVLRLAGLASVIVTTCPSRTTVNASLVAVSVMPSRYDAQHLALHPGVARLHPVDHAGGEDLVAQLGVGVG